MITLAKDAVVFGALFGAGVVLDEKTLLPLGTLGAVCGLVWWLGRKLQRLEDKQEFTTEQRQELIERQKEIISMIKELECVKHKNICKLKVQ